jgi:hypothetical protein
MLGLTFEQLTTFKTVNPFSARTRQGRVQNEVNEMCVPGHAGYGEFPSSSNISMNYITIYINYTELLVVCMHFNIICMHYGEQFAAILPIWSEFSYFWGLIF